MARAVATTKTEKSSKPRPKQIAAPISAPAPKLSKDELRARVDELERANATLRTKSRDANRAAKTSAARIAELEDMVAQLQKQQTTAKRAAKPAAPARTKRKSREIDPGDTVPSGVAVQEPEPLDDEAETALENLTEHLKAQPATDQ